jgi:restriction system protein
MDTYELIKSLRPVFLILGIIVFLKVFLEFLLPILIKEWKQERKFKQGSKWRKDRDKLSWLRGMTPKEFEDYVAELFRRLGYKTSSVGGPGDGGVDVIADKDGIKSYIQCKKYFQKHEVGVGEVRNFYGALVDRLANGKGYFITTSKFTFPAEQFAGDKPIELVDSYRLINYINLAEKKEEESKELTDKEICPECGGKLVKRKGKHSEFMGCSNYPKCHYTKNL